MRIFTSRCALASLAVVTTLVAIGGGIIGLDERPAQTTGSTGPTSVAVTLDEVVDAVERDAQVSRSADRLAAQEDARAERRRKRERRARHDAIVETKRDVLDSGPGNVVVGRVKITPPPAPEPEGEPSARASYDVSGNRALGLRLMLEFGFDRDQWPALETLWTRESGWNHLADNPTSSAYGIPQALPGSKMASAGADWATNPATQIQWGLGYIKDRYGTPAAALAHSDRIGWY